MTSTTYIEKIELNVEKMEEVIALDLTSNHNEMLVRDEIGVRVVERKRRNNVCKLLASRWLRTLALIAFVAIPLTIALTRQTPCVAAQGGCTPAPSGLVNWWPGDGNAVDIQGNSDGALQNGATFAIAGNSGDPQDGATVVQGMARHVFKFDGVNDYVSFGTSAGNFGTADFTIDFWIRTTSTRHEGVFGKRSVCNQGNLWDIRINDSSDPDGQGRILIAIQQDTAKPGTKIVSNRIVNDGYFHHVAFVRQGTTITLYIDGMYDNHGTTPVVVNINNSVALTAGKTTCSGTNGVYYFNGLLDELDLFNRALPASEVTAIALSNGKCKPDADGDGVTDALDACPGTPAGTAVNQSGCPVGACFAPPSGLVSWWPGDGPPNVNANDIQSGNPGTPLNGATFASGWVGQAFSLDGVDDYVEVPDSPSLTPSSFTLDAWVKPNSLSGGRSIVSKYNSNDPSQGASWNLETIPNTGRLRLIACHNASCSTRRIIETTSNVLTTGVWQHVAAVFEVGNRAMNIYVNGVEVPVAAGSTSTTIPSIYDSNTPVRIGVNVNVQGNFVNFWNGLIDEVEIFSRALTYKEIRAIYDAGSAGKCKSLAPNAVNDTATTREDAAVIIAVLDNDGSPTAAPLTVTEVTQGSNGSVINHGDGTVTYRPNANFNGTDSFTYSISDGKGETATATVNVKVESVNDWPAASDDAATTLKDTAVTINVLANDTDPDTYSYLRITGFGTYPANGTANYYNSGTVTYTPRAGFYGTDTFSYVVSDGIYSDSATVTVTVNNPLHDASFVSQTVPLTMSYGRQYPVTIRMRNTGSATWTSAEGYSLVSLEPGFDINFWGVSRVGVPAPVAPGNEVTFTFMVTAPGPPGQHTFRWQMMRSIDGGRGLSPFGFSTDALNITVTLY